MSRRYLVPTALAALATVQVLRFAGGDFVTRHAEDVGARVSRQLPRASPVEPELQASAELAASDAASQDKVSFEPTAAAVADTHLKKKKAAPVPPADIRVSATTVLRWARDGVRPVAIPVPADKNRPAGVKLGGVSALGIGVHEGDVLTHVDGHPIASAGEVIGLVLAARAKKHPTIGGRLYRDSKRYSITVEMPYIEAPAPAHEKPRIVAWNR